MVTTRRRHPTHPLAQPTASHRYCAYYTQGKHLFLVFSDHGNPGKVLAVGQTKIEVISGSPEIPKVKIFKLNEQTNLAGGGDGCFENRNEFTIIFIGELSAHGET